MHKKFLTLLSALLVSSMGFASGSTENHLKEVLHKALPGYTVTKVESSEMEGMYSVQLSGSDWIYVSKDGRFVFPGKMLSIQGDKIVDLTEKKLGDARKNSLAAVKQDDMVVFSPEGKVKGIVYAFTDVDCGYCKKFHQEVPRLNDLGVEVRYLAWPRSGLDADSVTYNKMKSVWCAKDRKVAMTQSKQGKRLATADKECSTPIPSQFKLGASLGVRGTPALFLEDGTRAGGYRKADDLARDMGISLK